MMTRSSRIDEPVTRFGRRLAMIVGALGAVTAALGFSGWLGSPQWQAVLEMGRDRVPTSPNTALCQFFMGAALFLLARWPAASRARAFATVFTGFVVAVSALTLVDNLTGHALRIDHWLLSPPGLTCPRGNGHMSPITAAMLLLMGTGLVLFARGAARVPAAIGSVALLIGWLVVTGYVADAPLFYGGPTIPVALLTGLGLASSGLALIVLVGTRAWPFSLLAGDSSRAVLLRGGVPWLLVLLLAFELAIGLAFRMSGPLRAYAFAGVLLAATVIDVVLIVKVGDWIGARLDRLYDQRRRLGERLRYRNKLEAIGTFASGAAHEINNPLQQIMSCAELIVDAPPDDPHIPLHARTILEASQRAATVTHRLLSHAAVDSTPLGSVRLVDVVTQTLALAATSFERAGVRVSLSVPVELPPILCRRGPLSQALLGVLVNAREALDRRFPGPDPAKTIDVRAEPASGDGGEVLRLTITDRGCGLPAGMAERVFEPFFTTKARDQGAGLGLWVTDAVVGELGGHVSIESTEGEGTRVILDLPVEPAEAGFVRAEGEGVDP